MSSISNLQGGLESSFLSLGLSFLIYKEGEVKLDDLQVSLNLTLTIPTNGIISRAQESTLSKKKSVCQSLIVKHRESHKL